MATPTRRYTAAWRARVATGNRRAWDAADRAPTPCPVEGCGRVLKGAVGLKVHVTRAHGRDAEKPVPCPAPDCDRRFATLAGLRVHAARMHGIKREKRAPLPDDGDD